MVSSEALANSINSDKSKAISIGMIMQVDVGNVNAGWTEGVVTVIKKVERPDGFFHPYISGQALRRYVRDTMKDILNDKNNNSLQMSPEEKSVDKKSPVVTAGDPRQYIDDDLFGFMKAIKRKSTGKQKKKTSEANNENNTVENSEDNIISEDEEEVIESVGTRKRTSPLRMAPAFGLFKLNSDRDLGTRSAMELAQSADAGGSIFETEITNNLFRSALLLELDRVGVWKGYETIDSKDKSGGQLDENTRKERIAILLESLKYLWGGGRQSRFLVDLTPHFIIYARMRRKIPLFLNSIDVEYISNNLNSNSNYRIKTEILREIIKDYSNDIQSLIIGFRPGNFINVKTDFEKLHNNTQVMTVGEAVDSMIRDIMSSNLY
jgi:CRISPR-associated protein Cst2